MGHMAEAIMTKSFINPRSRKYFKEKEEVFNIRFCVRSCHRSERTAIAWSSSASVFNQPLIHFTTINREMSSFWRKRRKLNIYWICIFFHGILWHSFLYFTETFDSST